MRQPFDFQIINLGTTRLTWSRVKHHRLARYYAMSERGMNVLKPLLDSMLRSDRIRESTAPCSALLMFAEKKDPEDPLRPVVDYHAINKMTVPVR